MVVVVVGIGRQRPRRGDRLADRACTKPDDVVLAKNTEGILERDTGKGAKIPN